MKNDKIYNNKIEYELLAPAGGITQYIAAVENGADAIYMGGKSYNARINASNFDDRQMEQAIDYGHLRGVKSYVTMNTLLSDEELPAALDYAKFLYKIGTDALIVQDLGFGQMVQQALPDFELHLSTQGSVYDRKGVEAASKLGYSRVVLARELSLEQIREACGQKKTEIEVFVHGALCMCYSGQCHLSRHIGGRSGNKGGCAQPCRLPYKYIDENGKLLGNKNRKNYPLSPRDLCLIEELGQLVDAGVTSFKIEGRMKSPEYVATVTSIYRKYLDMYLRDGSYTVTEEDWRDLNQIFNRGNFTQGYFYADPEDKLMCSGLPKHQGIKIATVEKQLQSGKFTRQQGGHLVDIKMDKGTEPLRLGDGVEIHGRELAGNVVTYLETLKNGTIRIGDIKGQVQPGDPVYRITSKDLIEKAKKTFENLTFDEGKFGRKTGIDAVFKAAVGQPSVLEITKPISLTVSEEAATAQAPLKRATTVGDIEKQLSKTGGTPFELNELTVEMPDEVMIPMSGLNALRRKALEKLEIQIKESSKRTVSENITISTVSDCNKGGNFINESGNETKKQFWFYDYSDFESYDFSETPGVCALIDAEEFVERFEEVYAREVAEDIAVHPYIHSIGKGTDKRIEDRLKQLKSLLLTTCGNGEERAVYVGNIGWIEPFASAGVKVMAEPGLNIYNEQTFKAYEKLGLSGGMKSLETGTDVDGNLPLMITEHEMTDGVLIDRKGMRLQTRFVEAAHKTFVTTHVDSEENGAIRTYI